MIGSGRRAAFIPLFAAVGIGGGVTALLLTVFNYFVEPMSHDLGLPAHEVSAALSFHLAALIVGLPLGGALADRIGPRFVICSSALLLGACLFGLSRIQENITSIYATCAVAGLVGAGASPVTYAKALVTRFDRTRGLALGVALSGAGFASIALPPIVRGIILEHGWRTGFVALAAIAVGAGLIGSIAASGKAHQQPAVPGVGTVATSTDDTLRTAAGRPVFWLLALALFLHGVAFVGVVAHLTEAWRSFGWPTGGVPAFQAALGIAAIIGRIAGGAAMDRVKPNFVGTAAGTIGAVALVTLLIGDVASMVPVLAGFLLGLCWGAESDVASVLSSRYFGVSRFAEIYAIQAAAFMVGAAVGPYAGALVADTASYRLVFLVAAFLFLVSAGLLAVLPKPPAIKLASFSA